MTIFLARVRHYRQQQLRFFHQLMDWTTWLYVVIPALLLIVYFYKETIGMGEFGVFSQLPFSLFLFLFFFIQGFASMRTWTYEADALFFMHQPRYKQLKRFGAYLSILRTMLVIVLLLLLLQPFITTQYDVSLWGLWLGAVNSFLLMAVITPLWKAKWVSYAVHILATLLQTTLWMVVPEVGVLYAATMLVVLCVLYERWHVQSTRFFAWQLQKEQEASHFFQQIVANVSLNYYGLSSAPVHQKRVRWPQFKWHAHPLYNLGCKVFMRNSDYRSGYVRFLAVQVPIYIAGPYYVDFLVVIAIYLTMYQWFRHVIVHLFDAPFFEHYPLQREERSDLLQFMQKRFVYIPFVVTVVLIVLFNTWPIYE